MNMTHYMELLATNQPWNLILFMAIPVILAETLAITELYLLFTRKLDGRVASLNRWVGIAVGLYFIGVIAWLVPQAVVPITQSGSWRTAIDVIAVGSYLLGGLPLVVVALQQLGLINRGADVWTRRKLQAICIALFLVLGHVAMIAGMADPGLLGWQVPAGQAHGVHGAADAADVQAAGAMPAHAGETDAGAASASASASAVPSGVPMPATHSAAAMEASAGHGGH